MDNQLNLFDGDSPFDKIRRVAPDGSEYWSARDLCGLMGYANWQNFQTPLKRAMRSAEAQGHAVETIFMRSHKNSPDQVGRPGVDYNLTRFASYLTAMNGDPNISDVANAQAYFAVKTRQAETQLPATPPAPAVELTGPELMAKALIEANSVMEAQRAELEDVRPKAEFYDDLMDAEGNYSMAAAARALGYGRNVLFKRCRQMGVLQGNNLPYRQYDHHFKVVPGTYRRRSGELMATATTYVRPSGLEFLRKKLAQADIEQEAAL